MAINSSPAPILLQIPAHSYCSSQISTGFPPPSRPHGSSAVLKYPVSVAVSCQRMVPSRLKLRDDYSMVLRCTGSSSSEGSTEDSVSSTGKEKVPFGYTRKDVLLIGLGVTLLGVGLKSGLEFVGVDPLKAGNVVQLVLVLGLTVGWISTYIFRVSNKDMTYAQQLKNYEVKVMEKRLEGLTEAELAVLMEEVEEEKRLRAVVTKPE